MFDRIYWFNFRLLFSFLSENSVLVRFAVAHMNRLIESRSYFFKYYFSLERSPFLGDRTCRFFTRCLTTILMIRIHVLITYTVYRHISYVYLLNKKRTKITPEMLSYARPGNVGIVVSLSRNGFSNHSYSSQHFFYLLLHISCGVFYFPTLVGGGRGLLQISDKQTNNFRKF